METFDAIVLAGGSSRRLGGADKALVEIGGMTLLERAFEAVAEARHIVCVGPRRSVPSHVTWEEESPPSGGPVAALAAGLPRVSAPIVVVLAVDSPLVDRTTVEKLVGQCTIDAAAIASGRDSRPQPLIGAYPTEALERAVTDVGDPDGVPVRSVLIGVPHALVDIAGDGFDCDTWEDVEEMRARFDATRRLG